MGTYNWNAEFGTWRWRIIVYRISMLPNTPTIRYRNMVGVLEVTTGSKQQEDEILYVLTSPNSVLHAILNSDGYYQLVFTKETPSSKMLNLPVKRFAFWGYAIISKHKDIIFWESKYFHVGRLNPLALQTRDIQEEQRRGHIKDIPGGGVDYIW